MEDNLYIWKWLFSLLFVLGGMWWVSHWLRRHRQFNPAAERRMKVLERVPVDARRSILLLSVDGESLVLGVSAERITLLKALDSRKESDTPAAAGPEFNVPLDQPDL